MPQRNRASNYQLAVIANDFQVPFHDEKALLLFKLFLRRERPDWLILNGDFQDFWEISNYDLTPRTGKEFKREIELGKSILRSFRRSLPRCTHHLDRRQPRIPAAKIPDSECQRALRPARRVGTGHF